jgi:hypothetical protein
LLETGLLHGGLRAGGALSAVHCNVAIVLECHYEKLKRIKKGWKTARFLLMLMVILYWENCINAFHYSGEISVVASEYRGCLKTYVTNFHPHLSKKVPINMGPKVNRFRDIDLRSCAGIEYYIRWSAL